MKKKKDCLYVRQRDRKELDMKSREREKKNKVLDCIKLEYYKEVDFSNIEYHIIFLITQIPSQQCHTSDSLGTRVH